MRTFEEWAGQTGQDLFEMANVITPEGEKGRWGLKSVSLEGPGVVNVLKDLGGSAGINDLATALIDASTVKIKDSEGDYVSLGEFAAAQGEPEEKLKTYLVNLQKVQLRKQKGGSNDWKSRISLSDGKWTLTDEAEKPKKIGGKKKDDYKPGFDK